MAFLQHHGPAPLSWLIVALALGVGCGDGPHSARNPAAPAAHDHGHGHSHVAPHGGTVVVLGDETYHVELLRDSRAGRITLYVLDGHLESFVRIAAPSLVLTLDFEGQKKTLELLPVAQSATGESVGNTSQFAAEAAWLKDGKPTAGSLRLIEVRGQVFHDVPFQLPGNIP